MEPLTKTEIFNKLSSLKFPYFSPYLAMYSSWLGGITTEPALMFVPVDDHLVHRGDGVFEAIKIVNGRAYLLEEHLDRLIKSASKLEFDKSVLESKFKNRLRNIILETSRIAASEIKSELIAFNAIIRLYLSRGPGSFGTNPYDSMGPQIYCVVTKLTSLAAEKYEKGVSLGRSQISVKPDWFSTVKSCNYLQNVLMKKESIDRGFDFTVSFTTDGLIAEGSTENIVIINKLGELVHPKLDYILKGTTMTRLFDLVELKALLQIKRGVDIYEKDLLEAKGIFMIGTTLDILPVQTYEGHKLAISNYSKDFLALLKSDQLNGIQIPSAPIANI